MRPHSIKYIFLYSIALNIAGTIMEKFPSVHFGLYRDDTLAFYRTTNGHTLDSLRKHLIHSHSSLVLKMTLETNLTVSKFLDVTRL